MRTYVLASLAVACLGLSACGGGDANHDVVPSSLPELTAPQGSVALSKPAGSSTTASGSQNQSQDQSSSSSSSSSTNGTTTQGGTSSQTPAPSTTQGGTGGTGAGGTGGTGTGTGTGTSTGTGSTGGAAPGEFSQFCQDNPGACPGN
jgi:hypothetical protein